MQERVWQLDFGRATAVIAMVAFNWQVALDYFGVRAFDATQGFWWWFARATVATFVFIAGASMWLAVGKHGNKWAVMRGAKLFGIGLLITLVTWAFLGKGFVVFGVLHLIGLSTIIAVPFLRVSSNACLLAGAGIIVAGVWLSSVTFSFPWLLWLGFVPAGFSSIDYEPLLPWFGVFLLGLWLARVMCERSCDAFRRMQPARSPFLAAPVCFLGRHSLAIYLLHQPLLLATLALLGARPV
ncbi:hypothetical protein COU36_02360 [Candidatus Micrarchaeota archaeon CG10_big_fil_rev_8_21_14_0_10_59_7]|nr:MAG: hypothetical protein COU36_02360 [Candidatus Micrarchaeota archaeon CG10_big_fil_rev_8_21_14_0_10_59_7]